MKLYHSPTSPYVRKVMLVIDHHGLSDRVEIVPGTGTPIQPNEATVTVNPLGKIPCLVADDGLALYDSRVICRYLDEVAGGGLYAKGWPAIVREATADGILDAGLLAVYEWRLRPEESRYQPWIDAQRGKITRAIAHLETQAGEIAGPPAIDQIAVACALGYVDFRFPDIDWRADAPTLAAWFAGYAESDVMKRTVPQG